MIKRAHIRTVHIEGGGRGIARHFEARLQIGGSRPYWCDSYAEVGIWHNPHLPVLATAMIDAHASALSPPKHA